MDNYKIKLNPKPLTDQQIDNHKDFSKLLSNQQKLHRYKDATRPLYKNIGLMSIVILIGIVLLMLILDNNEEKTPNTPDTLSVKNSDTEISKPVENTDKPVNSDNTPTTTSTKPIISQSTQSTTPVKSIPYEVFHVDAEKGAILYTLSGGRILVPEFAFFDKDGNVTKKEITLYYYEYKNLEEAGLKAENIPALLVELKAEESISRAPVTLTQAIELEATTPLYENAGTVAKYSSLKEKWEPSGKERIAYRYRIQSNETDFPELEVLKGLIWELPEQAGKPSEFGYIFNRPWRNFTYTKSTSKEIQLKNTNTSYKTGSEPSPLLASKKEDQKLLDAITVIYTTPKKNQAQDNYKQAVILVTNWKNSPEGKSYTEWLKGKTGDNQLASGVKTSKIAIKTVGFTSLSYSTGKTNTLQQYKRTLRLLKYPEKGQDFSNGDNHN